MITRQHCFMISTPLRCRATYAAARRLCAMPPFAFFAVFHLLLDYALISPAPPCRRHYFLFFLARAATPMPPCRLIRHMLPAAFAYAFHDTLDAFDFAFSPCLHMLMLYFHYTALLLPCYIHYVVLRLILLRLMPPRRCTSYVTMATAMFDFVCRHYVIYDHRDYAAIAIAY